MTNLELQNVSAHRGSFLALRDLSCSFPASSFTLLLGPSGSGKSTLLRLWNRLGEKSSGRILFNDQPIEQMNLYQLRRSIGFVPQDLGLFPHRTLAQQILLASSTANPEALLAQVELPPPYASRYPRQLSGGEQQRAAIARALAASPPALLLDEAFSALDPPLRQDLLALVAGLGRTTILTSHDPAPALRYATQVVFLSQGELLFAGTPEEYLQSDLPLLKRYREAS
ncbi:MAG: ATP-binding cassette domain-containing protein [Bryobacter sp.]|nr:ATP-binding cassette domain-containing protein [Bryobacter sp.]